MKAMWLVVRSRGKLKPYIPSAHLFVKLSKEFKLKYATTSNTFEAKWPELSATDIESTALLVLNGDSRKSRLSLRSPRR